MGPITIRPACKEDAQAVTDMLISLAGDIGDQDRFRSTIETVTRYGFGKTVFFHGIIAHAQSESDCEQLGLALYYPIFSTIRARPGLYIMDLWVSEKARGKGLGRDIISHAIKQARKDWDATYLSLTVYNDNPSATDFYNRLGFNNDDNDCPMMLEGKAFEQLGS